MKNAIAIDIGGTNIKYALVDETGKISLESVCSSKSDESNTTLEQLKAAIKELLAYASHNNLEVAGIGIGVPSVVDDGLVLFANNLKEIDNINLKDVIGEEFNIPVFVDNDANLMGLGETRYGKAKDVTDVVFLTIGTGIGGTLIINGRLWGGYRNRGTELGHIIINCDGKSCSCGASGCLEAYASVTALIEDYKELLSNNNIIISPDTIIDGRYIVSQYMKNEEYAVEAMNAHFKYMAAGIAGMINIFAPQKVILGGGITESGDFYIENISRLTMQQVMKETSCYVSIEAASLGNKAGFYGAAALVFKASKPVCDKSASI